MFSFIRSLVSAEWKRLVKYTVVGTALGAGTGYGTGLLIMSAYLKEQEDEIKKSIESIIPSPVQPVTNFIVDRIVSRIKREGAESLAFSLGWYGLLSGCSLGFTRISVGLGVRALVYVGKKVAGKKK